MVLALMFEAWAPMCLGRGAGSSVIGCSVVKSSPRSWSCAFSMLVEKEAMRRVVLDDDCWKRRVVVSMLLLG